MIVWGGRSSDNVRVVVERYPNLPRPARKQEVVQVPGRNGDLIFQQDAFENYIQPYDIYISAELPRLPPVARKVAEWLYGPKGYQRLEDWYEPEYYRMAYYSGPVEIENILNRFGRATIEFNCKPQRFLKAGEWPIAYDAPSVLFNPYFFPAEPLIKVNGNGPGALQIGGYVVDILALDGSLMLDSRTQNAYLGTLNKNADIKAAQFPRLEPGENEIAWSGGVTSVEITPNWWTL